MHVMSPVQQANLEYGKAYKKDDLNTVVQVVALLYSGITSHPHP